MKRTLVLLCIALSPAALAQDVDVSEPVISRGQGWSYLSGKTVGSGNTVVVGEVGAPGLSVGVLRGVSSQVDIGGQFSFNYLVQGIVTQVYPGLAIQGVLRLALLESGRINLGLNFKPGPYFYFMGRNTYVGLNLPFELAVGIPIGSAVMVNSGIDFPMYVAFGVGGGLYFPIGFGAGIEYFIDSKLAVSFNMRMGPTITPYGSAPFTLQKALIGIGYKL